MHDEAHPTDRPPQPPDSNNMAGDTAFGKSGVPDVQMDIDQGSPEHATSSSPRLSRNIDPQDHPMGEASPEPHWEGGPPSIRDRSDTANRLARTRRRTLGAASRPAAAETSSESGSSYAPEQAEGLSDSSSARQDGNTEERPEPDEISGSASLSSMNPDPDPVGSQMATNVDLYFSPASGMSLAVIDCFEELFGPGKHGLDKKREIDEAIESGMDPTWSFIEAARTHRALKGCIGLDPETALYERLFIRIASALVSALSTKGTATQQKCVFLLGATSEFWVEQTESGPEYYFEGLHLMDSLFHADFLISKLIHTHMALMRWSTLPKPDDYDKEPAGGWQWTHQAEPLVSSSGVGSERSKRPSTPLKLAKNKVPKSTSKSFSGTQAPSLGTNTPGDTDPDTPEADRSAGTPGSGRRNAKETQPLAKGKGGSWSEREKRTLIRAVGEYGPRYSKICKAIAEGKIPMDIKDRSQPTVRSALRSWKVLMLKNDEVLPRGFDGIRLGKSFEDKVKDEKRNPKRKESDVDEHGRPTNTQLDAEQEPEP